MTMNSEIPDEAVDAAARVLDNPQDPYAITDIAREMLKAAYPHLGVVVDWWGVCQVCKGEVSNEGSRHASNCPVLLRTRIRELEDGIRNHSCGVAIGCFCPDPPPHYEHCKGPQPTQQERDLHALLDGTTP